MNTSYPFGSWAWQSPQSGRAQHPDSGAVEGRPLLQKVLIAWKGRGWLHSIDVCFAEWLGREAPQSPPALLLAAAILSQQLGKGRIWLDLEQLLADPVRILSLGREDEDGSNGGDIGSTPCGGAESARVWMEEGARERESEQEQIKRTLAWFELADWPNWTNFTSLLSLGDGGCQDPGPDPNLDPGPDPNLDPGPDPDPDPGQEPGLSLDLDQPQDRVQNPGPALGLATGPGNSPLVLQGSRLYLRRYWQYEQKVWRGLNARLASSPQFQPVRAAPARIHKFLDTLFPRGLHPVFSSGSRVPSLTCGGERSTESTLSPGGYELTVGGETPGAVTLLNQTVPDWQKIACVLGLRGALAVFTGGPGTGKTTTVVKLLALLQALALDPALLEPEPVSPDLQIRATGDAPSFLRICLTAPTGKAAARLGEAIATVLARLALEDWPQGALVRAALPTRVYTLHRLLGFHPGNLRFRHGTGNPLSCDVLVIDEASMLDVALMAAVLDALSPGCRLILLGDKDQLASVEAGAVLGSICARAREGHYRPDLAAWVEASCGEKIPAAQIDQAGAALDQSVVMLRASRRFAADSGIGQLAQEVNEFWSGRGRELQGITFRALARLRAEGLNDVRGYQLRTGESTLNVVEGGSDSGGKGSGGAERPPGTAADNDRLLHRLVEGWEADPGGYRHDPGQEREKEELASRRARGYRHYLEVLQGQRPAAGAPAEHYDAWARAVLRAFGSFQVLCATRRGRWGVNALNSSIEHQLWGAGLISAPQGWYLGRPVLVTRNDYGLGLMNGDVGVTLERPLSPAYASLAVGASAVEVGASFLEVVFLAAEGGGAGADRGADNGANANARVRWIHPSRLRAVQTVFALTVHKAQGSEFDHVGLVLPEATNPLFTRELLYTGITRARHHLTVAGPLEEGQDFDLPELRFTGAL